MTYSVLFNLETCPQLFSRKNTLFREGGAGQPKRTTFFKSFPESHLQTPRFKFESQNGEQVSTQTTKWIHIPNIPIRKKQKNKNNHGWTFNELSILCNLCYVGNQEIPSLQFSLIRISDITGYNKNYHNNTNYPVKTDSLNKKKHQ